MPEITKGDSLSTSDSIRGQQFRLKRIFSHSQDHLCVHIFRTSHRHLVVHENIRKKLNPKKNTLSSFF